jgi:hypothetical protein
LIDGISSKGDLGSMEGSDWYSIEVIQLEGYEKKFKIEVST